MLVAGNTCVGIRELRSPVIVQLLTILCDLKHTHKRANSPISPPQFTGTHNTGSSTPQDGSCDTLCGRKGKGQWHYV